MWRYNSLFGVFVFSVTYIIISLLLAGIHPALSDMASSTTVETEKIKCWADVADEPEEVAGPPDLEELTIDESKRRNQTLSDPDDTSIEAVCNLFSPKKLYLLLVIVWFCHSKNFGFSMF